VGKYVVDTDTGVDDAMAILQILAARKKGQVDKRLWTLSVIFICYEWGQESTNHCQLI